MICGYYDNLLYFPSNQFIDGWGGFLTWHIRGFGATKFGRG